MKIILENIVKINKKADLDRAFQPRLRSVFLTLKHVNPRNLLTVTLENPRKIQDEIPDKPPLAKEIMQKKLDDETDESQNTYSLALTNFLKLLRNNF